MLISYIRTVILYSVLLCAIRLMGKRQLGEMEPSEFVITMLMANLATVPMQDSGIPLMAGLVPILTVLGLELILAVLSLRSIFWRKLLCGKPVILMEHGKILQDNLRRTRISADELTELLRENGTTDLTTVQFAILETDGQISTLLYPQFMPATAKDAGIRVQEQHLPVTLISDGHVLDHNLEVAGRDRAWLDQQLKAHGCTVRQVFLMTVEKGSGKLYLARKEGAK